MTTKDFLRVGTILDLRPKKQKPMECVVLKKKIKGSKSSPNRVLYGYTTVVVQQVVR